MRRLALLSLVQATLALTAPALRPRARGQFLRSSPDDDEAPPEINEDFRDFRARLIARTKGEGLTEAGDEKAVAEGWYDDDLPLEFAFYHDEGRGDHGGLEQEALLLRPYLASIFYKGGGATLHFLYALRSPRAFEGKQFLFHPGR